ncbi:MULTISPECIES: MFS transporter [Micrococcaceae]|uniref:Major facilitator superfamily MFS_1 n=1 Tax=Arthrobacter rhombi TaxID=71253 RepID=A0A1R4GA58_9MICC|nr:MULTISPECIES: MFS transporter [Micrococcaceae]SJM65046.1 major facilitator superfamily MFS_1 [Arthrobacter rhombi]
MSTAGGPGGLRRHAPFVRFWAASTVSDFGTYVTSVALAVLVLVTLDGNAQDQGWVSAARWAPYLIFGLVAGIWVDRFSRRRALMVADLGRAVLLGVLCIGGVSGWLSVSGVIALVFGFGALSLVGDAAYQSFIPQLVPRKLLVRANVRLEQSDTVAQTVGGAVAGSLVAVLTAPWALLLDAGSFLFSGVVVATLPGRPTGKAAPATNHGATPSLRARVVESVRWLYGHYYLGPLAWSTHVWFIGSAMVGTVLPVLILQTAGLGPFDLGVVLSCAGVGAVVGTSASARCGERWGTGRIIVLSRGLEVVSVVAVASIAALLPQLGPASGDRVTLLVCLGAAQLLWGVAMGVESPLEMGFWQGLTPDGMIARMTSVRRSANRGMIVLGAPLGGFIATSAGVGTALWVAAGFIAVGTALLGISPFRAVRLEDVILDDEETAGQ